MTNQLTAEEFAARALTDMELASRIDRIADEPRWLNRAEKAVLLHEAARRVRWFTVDRPDTVDKALDEADALLKSDEYDHFVGAHRAAVHSYNTAFHRWDSLTGTQKRAWRGQYWVAIALACQGDVRPSSATLAPHGDPHRSQVPGDPGRR